MSSLARPSCLCPAAWKYTRRRCILRTLSCISTSLLSSAASRPTANFGSCRPPPWPATINNISNLASQHSNIPTLPTRRTRTPPSREVAATPETSCRRVQYSSFHFRCHSIQRYGTRTLQSLTAILCLQGWCSVEIACATIWRTARARP